MSLRAGRLGGAEGVRILAETELATVCATLEQERPDVCVIDSVQTLHASELGSAPGSVAQVREAAGRLLRVAKEAGIATILVGHVTKDGAVAGPRVLEHVVDCVLQFEGDRYHAHRVLRATKNRFGSTNEVGVFEMTGAGLVGVPDPSELFGARWAGRVPEATLRRGFGGFVLVMGAVVLAGQAPPAWWSTPAPWLGLGAAGLAVAGISGWVAYTRRGTVEGRRGESAPGP